MEECSISAELEAIEPRFDQGSCSSLTHAIYLHKYTEYCGDAQHIVTAVSCRGPTTLGDDDMDTPNRAVHSAVFLIDVTERDAPVYTNLTRAIQDRFADAGTPLGLLMSSAATCATPTSGVP